MISDRLSKMRLQVPNIWDPVSITNYEIGQKILQKKEIVYNSNKKEISSINLQHWSTPKQTEEDLEKVEEKSRNNCPSN